MLNASLDMGAFGVSRYRLDHSLYELALSKGCRARLNTQALDISFVDEVFTVKLSNGSEENARIVLGTFGKRSNMDRQLNRSFFYKRSPYLGIKYHIKTDFPKDRIALHNFKDGYCGISPIEDGKYCFCALTTRDNLKKYGSIPEMEKNILYKNPHLKYIFQNSEFLYEKPEVINEISFEKKTTVENNILFSGDTAGMIAPLCGNGMSMAIHSAKILSDSILKHYSVSGFNRAKLETEYSEKWNRTFSRRLWIGKKIQDLFGQEFLTDAVVRTLRLMPPVTQWLVKQTHGEEF
jgi:flavin-dependent dehydrogenase